MVLLSGCQSFSPLKHSEEKAKRLYEKGRVLACSREKDPQQTRRWCAIAQEMKEVDQEARRILMACSLISHEDRALLRAMDTLTEKFLSLFVHEKGEGDFLSTLSPACQENVWLLSQHAPSVEFQHQLLARMEDTWKKGKLPSPFYAYLHDRVRMKKGIPQRYGTQVVYDQNKKRWTLFPVEEEKTLADRREKMNLPPLETYLNGMNDLLPASIGAL